MQRPLKVAIAGAGYFARFHFDGWARIPGVTIIAAADRDQSKVEAYAQDFNVAATYTSVEQMLAEITPDILDIATPPATHAAFVALGLGRAETVVCQKAFCRDLVEARATAALAADAPNRLVVHENFRFEPWYREIKRQLDSGRLGDIYQITFRLRPGDGQGPDAYLARQPYFQQMPHFLIRETGIHFIDTFRYLFGEVEGVFADLRRLNPVIAGEDAGIVLFRFTNGRRALFDGNRLADHAAADRRKTMGELWIDGSAGSLRLDGAGRLFWRAHATTEEQELSFAWDDRGYGGDCVHLFQAHVADHIRTGSALETRARDYLRNLEIEAAIYASSEHGAYVRIGHDSPGVLDRR